MPVAAGLTVTAMAGYPVSSDPFYQPAPSIGGVNAKIYTADYGLGLVLRSPMGGPGRPGGVVATYQTLSTTVGIATEPTGQY